MRTMIMEIVIDDGVQIPSGELEFTSSRSRGPGGQHVNKVSSRVTLRFNVRNSPSLTNAQKKRIFASLQTRVNKEGVLQLHSQKYRSQSANRDEVIERMRILLEAALKPRRRRVPTRISKRIKEKRLDEKKHRGQLKASRSRQYAGE